nr:hypothetical protein [Tanacetum cinerariifolium]
MMGNEELKTILKKELDEFIKSSIEDLILIPSESEDTSRSDRRSGRQCENLFEPSFRINDEFISSDVNPLFDEMLKDIECKDSYDPNLDESTFLVTPLFDFNKDEYFTPGDDVELLLHRDPSIPKMSVASILEGFIDELPLKENDDLFDLDMLKDIECEDSYDPNLDESTFLVTPLFDFNKDEYFTLGDDVELLLHRHPSIPKMSVAFILEGFIDELPLEENDDLFDLDVKNDD